MPFVWYELLIIFCFIDVSEFKLTDDSPQIDGTSLNATFQVSGCAQVTCLVTYQDEESDCKFSITFVHYLVCMYSYIC